MSKKYTSSGGSTLRGSQRGSSDNYEYSQWSEWKWSDQFQCYERYRLKGPEDYEWDYDQVGNQDYQAPQPVIPPSTEQTPRDRSADPPHLRDIIGEPHELPLPAAQANVGHDPVDQISRSLGAATLSTSNYGLYSGNYSGSYSGSSKNPPRVEPSNEPRWIYTRNTNSNAETVDKRFKVHRSKDFSFGKVFKILWSEPSGSGGTEITERGPRAREKGIFIKQRRFVVVDTRKGHSICLPIMTYGGQGTLKYGVHPDDHAAIYSSRREGPRILDREEMTNEPIRVEVIDPANKLDPMSRLNYAKLYTVEHNVKVFFIGKIAKSNEQKVVNAYNATHLPLPDRPDQPAGTTDETFEHAEGQDPDYPQDMDEPLYEQDENPPNLYDADQ